MESLRVDQTIDYIDGNQRRQAKIIFFHPPYLRSTILISLHSSLCIVCVAIKDKRSTTLLNFATLTTPDCSVKVNIKHTTPSWGRNLRRIPMIKDEISLKGNISWCGEIPMTCLSSEKNFRHSSNLSSTKSIQFCASTQVRHGSVLMTTASSRRLAMKGVS